MQVLERAESEKGELRAKLEAALEKVKAAGERLEETTAKAAKASAKVIREHPYEAAGIAFGVGLLIGFLATRGRHE